MLAAIAVVCLLSGGYLIVNVVRYDHHSTAAGHALVEQVSKDIKKQVAAPTPGCALPPAKRTVHPGDVLGVLEIPRLKMTAPVVEGVDEKQLSVAVGHLDTSAWPGSKGTSVLAAHDVTWFSRIDHLKPADEFTLKHGCAVDTYRVREHKVVKKGSPLYHADKPQVVLETCWPTTALYWTNERYLVFADLVDTQIAMSTATEKLAEGDPFVVPAIEKIANDAPGVPHGSLRISGSADDGWRQSNQPLLLAHAAIANYKAALQAIVHGSDAAWKQVAPHVARPAFPHPGAATIGEHTRQIDIEERLQGEVVTAVLTTTAVHLEGQGIYQINTRQTVTEGKLRIADVSMTLVKADAYSPSPTPSASASASASTAPKPAPKPATTSAAPAPSSPAPTRTAARSPSASPSATATPTPSRTASAASWGSVSPTP